MNIKHLAPTPLGERVTVRVELIPKGLLCVQVDRHKLTFSVEAFDEHRQIGIGTHRRAIIDAKQPLRDRKSFGVGGKA